MSNPSVLTIATQSYNPLRSGFCKAESYSQHKPIADWLPLGLAPFSNSSDVIGSRCLWLSVRVNCRAVIPSLVLA